MTTSGKSLALVRAGFVFAFILGFSQYSLGQSGQYKRPKKPTAEGAIAQPLPADSKGAPVTGVPTKDDKVDIKEIENQYWSSKDTEFKVVQNRRYTKERRWFVSTSGGNLIGDENSVGYSFSGSVGYFFTEQYGVEVMGTYIDARDTKAIAKFKNQYTVTIDHNKPKMYAGAAFIYSPIYAKLSVLDSQIIYFDMSIAPSLGVSIQEHQRRLGDVESDPYITLGIDIAQHFYISNHFAVRFDFRNRFFSEEEMNWNNTGIYTDTFTSNSRIVTTINAGVEFFF